MWIAGEWLLVAGILLFYLQDAALLLYHDEVAISERWRSWNVSASAGVELAGRHLFMPNPLLPQRAVFRATWTATDGADDGARLDAFLSQLMPFRIGCVLAWSIVLVAIPASVLAHRSPTLLLAELLASYLVTAAMGVFAWRRRKALGLDTKAALGLIAETLLCPPYSVNTLRRLCRHHAFGSDPVAFAARRCNARDRATLRQELLARTDIDLSFADPGSAQHASLQARHERIARSLPA
ncbi:MAG: hypothetical protein JSR63_01915 [Proteobacteria bacterium]|nr:hypothetical protein [Pseudomonadota bacterium]MBS0216916.1 hypothetical protein [Pseudomonadota bacterium]